MTTAYRLKICIHCLSKPDKPPPPVLAYANSGVHTQVLAPGVAKSDFALSLGQDLRA